MQAANEFLTENLAVEEDQRNAGGVKSGVAAGKKGAP
jgi:hypothetical protein